jgi:hypothetical protein
MANHASAVPVGTGFDLEPKRRAAMFSVGEPPRTEALTELESGRVSATKKDSGVGLINSAASPYDVEQFRNIFAVSAVF